MRKTFTFIVIAGALSFASCLNNHINDEPVDNSSDKFSDLKIQESFNWETSIDVEASVESDHIAQVSVSTGLNEKPFATFFGGGSLSGESMKLNVAASTTTLYLSYMTTAGVYSAPKAVNIINNKLAFAPSSDQRPFDEVSSEELNGVVYVPAIANGWATMMFEDTWPGYGDYDFNDVVFNYKMQWYLTGANMVEAVQIGLRVKAVSGSLPYEIYLRFHGINNNWIDYVEQMSMKNTLPNANVAMTLLDPVDPNKDRAIFRFDGVRGNVNKPSGSIWLNTEPGYELSDDQYVEVSYVVYFKTPIAAESAHFAGVDMFLAREDQGKLSAEIHRCNYEPINMDYYFGAVKDPQRSFYKSKDNLIWAVNIPADVAHTYEKAEFLKAYPAFKAWAQSSGTEAKDWYKRENSEFLVK